jgi:hypothetical protein
MDLRPRERPGRWAALGRKPPYNPSPKAGEAIETQLNETAKLTRLSLALVIQKLLSKIGIDGS